MLRKLPSISLVAVTLNANLNDFERVLKSVEMQDYPKSLLEYIIVDGGSTNGTIALAEKYNCIVVNKSGLQQKDEYRLGLGMKKAKGELILILESDNILTSKNWLKEMVQPFLESKDIFCTYSAYNGYEKTMSATTKYCAFFGTPDPTLYYLKKSEKIPLTEKKYNLGKILKETKKYYEVTFSKETLPTLGNNGHMFYKKVIMKVLYDLNTYTHTDAFMELYEMGYTKFGVVKNTIIHIANPNFKKFVARRVEVKKAYYDGRRGKRKYLVYNPAVLQDKINLIKFIIFSLTIIQPLWKSIKGFSKIHDFAWFLHPVLCVLMVFGYGQSEIERYLKITKRM